MPIGRYKEVKLFGNPGCWRSSYQPTKGSVKRVRLHTQQDRYSQVPTGGWLTAAHGPDLRFHLVLRKSKFLGIYPLKGHI
jgi:hypothetical protein